MEIGPLTTKRMNMIHDLLFKIAKQESELIDMINIKNYEIALLEFQTKVNFRHEYVHIDMQGGLTCQFEKFCNTDKQGRKWFTTWDKSMMITNSSEKLYTSIRWPRFRFDTDIVRR